MMKNNFGQFTKQEDGYQVKFERTFPFDIDTVWEAITNPARLAIWFTDIEMDFKEGGAMTIYFRDKERTKSSGKIIRINRPHLFQYTWEDELATWELFEEGNSCRLVLTYSKLPDQYAKSVPAGWHILLDQLSLVLHGRTEPYPFGGDETEEGNRMKKIYAELIEEQFPTLKTITNS